MARAWFGGGGRLSSAEATGELALLALVAENLFSQRWSAFARALFDDPDLAELDWDWVTHRVEAIATEAPLFTETRTRVIDALRGTGRGAAALALARRLLEPGEPHDADTLLADVAARLELPPPEGGAPMPALTVAAFDDPDRPEQVHFHDALRRADAEERRLLLEKLQLARLCLDRWGSEARLVALGRQRPYGHALLRVDAVLSASGTVFLGRLLARGEALHPTERRLFPAALDELALGERLLIAHRGRLCAPDRALVDALPPDLVERVAIP